MSVKAILNLLDDFLYSLPFLKHLKCLLSLAMWPSGKFENYLTFSLCSFGHFRALELPWNSSKLDWREEKVGEESVERGKRKWDHWHEALQQGLNPTQNKDTNLNIGSENNHCQFLSFFFKWFFKSYSIRIPDCCQLLKKGKHVCVHLACFCYPLVFHYEWWPHLYLHKVAFN